MTATTMLLAIGATYRVTLLVVADRITRAPRAWLIRRGHRLVAPTTESAEKPTSYWRCTCGVELLSARSSTSAVDQAMDGHVAELPDLVGGWRYLLTCPWCASIHVATVVVATAVAWGTSSWWQAAALVLTASGATGVVASIAAPEDGT